MIFGTKLSVHILLPDAINKKFERWADKTPGASWPAWGGHVTLVPNFVTDLNIMSVKALIGGACVNFTPFEIALSYPVATQDRTRPHYQAVFLAFADEENLGRKKLIQLQREIDRLLGPVRRDVKPELNQQTYVPHITLALGLAEAEATRMVNDIRNDNLVAEFVVDEISLLALLDGAGDEAQMQRHAIKLGIPVPAER